MDSMRIRTVNERLNLSRNMLQSLTAQNAISPLPEFLDATDVRYSRRKIEEIAAMFENPLLGGADNGNLFTLSNCVKQCNCAPSRVVRGIIERSIPVKGYVEGKIGIEAAMVDIRDVRAVLQNDARMIENQRSAQTEKILDAANSSDQMIRGWEASRITGFHVSIFVEARKLGMLTAIPYRAPLHVVRLGFKLNEVRKFESKLTTLRQLRLFSGNNLPQAYVLKILKDAHIDPLIQSDCSCVYDRKIAEAVLRDTLANLRSKKPAAGGNCDATLIGALRSGRLISDREWAFMERYVVRSGPRSGRPPTNHRARMNGVFFVARAEVPDKFMPSEFGSPENMKGQRHRWTKDGLWGVLLRELEHTEGAGPTEPRLTFSERTWLADQVRMVQTRHQR